MYELDSETIDTPAGQYQVTWYQDDRNAMPDWDGIALAVDGSAHCASDCLIDIDRGDIPGVVWSQLRLHSRHGYGDCQDWEYRSGAALVRWLTLTGRKGVTLVDRDYHPVEPSANRLERVHGIAWAPDDVPDDRATEFVANELESWRAWAEGDIFGWVLTGPDGEEVEDGAVWGYYGLDREREYTLSDARDIAEWDAAERVKQANLAGAGFIGVI